MKFCDKLQKIRKENNVTQEQLADKLGVSRQAVSKWESDQAYPDTEKLIQISKIFNVSLDELINDTKDSNKKVANKKINFMEILNTVYEFISKTFNMFWSMKFGEKIKFLFEMAILIIIIIFISGILTEMICGILRRIFIFLPFKIINGIVYIVDTLLYVIWMVLGGVIFVKVLKTRYLDYYVVINDQSVDKVTIEEPIKELKEKKDYKIVIRDPQHSGSSIFGKLAKLCIFCLKILGLLLLMPVVFGFIVFVILFVVSLWYVSYGLFFNGLTIAILGGIIFIYLIIKFILTLTFNRKLQYKKMFILFIAGISLMGVGFGLSTRAFTEFEICEEPITEAKMTNLSIKMEPNLVMLDMREISNDRIVIDNNLKEIKLDVVSYNDSVASIYSYNTYFFDETTEENKNVKVFFINVNYDGIKEVNRVLNDLKHKKINVYDWNRHDYQIDKMYISSANLTKLKENSEKYDK